MLFINIDYFKQENLRSCLLVLRIQTQGKRFLGVTARGIFAQPA